MLTYRDAQVTLTDDTLGRSQSRSSSERLVRRSSDFREVGFLNDEAKLGRNTDPCAHRTRLPHL